MSGLLSGLSSTLKESNFFRSSAIGRLSFTAAVLIGSSAVSPVFAEEAPAAAPDAVKAEAVDGGVEAPNEAQDEASNEAGETSDPLEGVNRFTSGFNRVARDVVLDPIVDGFQAVLPDPVEEAISNVISNLSEPFTIGSSLLQGDTENAGLATSRFIVNSIVGIGGIGDPATDLGVEARDVDLGQAAGANGMAPGPHIVLPILGPSNMRDLSGDLLQGLANPLGAAYTVAKGGVGYSENQKSIQELNRTALDPDGAERGAYEQYRKNSIKYRDGVETAGPDMDDGPGMDDGPSMDDSPSMNDGPSMDDKEEATGK